MLLASCHGSGKQATTTTGSAVPSTDTTGRVRVSLALHLGSLHVQAVGAPTRFDPAAANAILRLMNNYIAKGIARPLFTGTAASGLTAYFAPILNARIHLKGRDRAALTDEGAPVVTTVTGAVRDPLDLLGLEDNGQLVMVSGQFGLTVKGMTADGPLVIARVGNFLFEPSPTKEWRITGYDIIVRREIGQSSTTQQATTTTAAK
jgi:hypothetical protein